MRAVITEWGAKPSRTSLSTDGIQGAIDACANFGGGTVVVPAGHTFVSGSLVLKAGVELHLEEGSVLLASGDYADYAPHHDISVLTDTVVSETVLPRRAFIAGYRAHGCSITGPGEINGHADAFIARRGETIHTMRAPAGGEEPVPRAPLHNLPH